MVLSAAYLGVVYVPRAAGRDPGHPAFCLLYFFWSAPWTDRSALLGALGRVFWGKCGFSARGVCPWGRWMGPRPYRLLSLQILRPFPPFWGSRGPIIQTSLFCCVVLCKRPPYRLSRLLHNFQPTFDGRSQHQVVKKLKVTSQCCQI